MLREPKWLLFYSKYQIVMPTAYASISAYYAISKTRYILIEYDIDIILLRTLLKSIRYLIENKSVVKRLQIMQ
jgi:hypothetical protein